MNILFKSVVFIISVILDLCYEYPIIAMCILIPFSIYILTTSTTSHPKGKNGIVTMNLCRYTADKLTDDELMELIEKNSIGEFARIGYMAAFADRYPPRACW